MTKSTDAKHSVGIMSRLASNQEGNIIAIFAVAIIPAIALVGGAVDMSRLYLTQVRLQGACDAGALLGRKTMGTGTWTANNNAANAQAISMFDQNFENEAYGSTGLTRAYTESDGTVIGTASVTVPMTLMQVLGQSSKIVSVSCRVDLRIPNTDIMFVLDTTGSMAEAAAGSATSKISGLRVAVKCFYEALVKSNIADVTPDECGETADPINTNSPNVQLRFGFVPYSMNVNVGRLLPQDYLADEWTYQSRAATRDISGPATTATYGNEGAATIESTGVTNFVDTGYVNTGVDIVANGQTYAWYSKASAAECSSRSPPPDNNGPIITQNKMLISQTPTNPVAPDSTLTRYYETVTEQANRTYRYFSSLGTDCILRVKSTNKRITTEITKTETPIYWVTNFTGWIYRPVNFNVSALKAADGAWASSVLLPLGTNGTNTAISWAGCIEERQTWRSIDDNPFNKWDPIPESALDMNIDLIPTNDVNTKWGPWLPNAIWQRYTINTNSAGIKTRSNIRTLNEVFISSADEAAARPPRLPRPEAFCPSPSRKIQVWNPTELSNYVNALRVDGFTYHDIGLLWGARIISPTGIFSELNAPKNIYIERHIIFMTDGETATSENHYTAYGANWYDRRQTPANAAPNTAMLDPIVDARTEALCKAIKDKNITLWVVSYGNVASATNKRLETCASRGKFYQAKSVASLITNFKGIASQISSLRIAK